VATKYPRAATEHFATRGVQAEVIYVQGSVEIAPLVGLADLIVDLVESGATLRDNGLVEKETIASVSSVLVANPSLYKLRYADIEPLVSALRAAVEASRTQRS
jgi:ATP phosphoribosyltransferase